VHRCNSERAAAAAGNDGMHVRMNTLDSSGSGLNKSNGIEVRRGDDDDFAPMQDEDAGGGGGGGGDADIGGVGGGGVGGGQVVVDEDANMSVPSILVSGTQVN
jgi:hypothetical protein